MYLFKGMLENKILNNTFCGIVKRKLIYSVWTWFQILAQPETARTLDKLFNLADL